MIIYSAIALGIILKMIKWISVIISGIKRYSANEHFQQKICVNRLMFFFVNISANEHFHQKKYLWFMGKMVKFKILVGLKFVCSFALKYVHVL